MMIRKLSIRDFFSKGGKATLLIVLAVAMVFCVVGCSKSNDEVNASDDVEKVLNVGSSSYSVDASLDPLDGSWNYCYVCYEGLAETLFKISDEWTPEPWLATSAEPIDDTYKVWTVTLRDDVTYHNGDKMTGESVKACLERAMNDSDQARGILNMESIEADGQTLTITLASPVVNLEQELCNSVFVIYEVPEDGDYANNISFTGPYMLSEYKEGVSKTMVPYKGYYNGVAKIDKVNYIVYTDMAAQLTALESGDLDFVMGVPFENLETYENDPNYTVTYADPNSDEMIYFNENRAATSDTAVKHAIAMALDRETICADGYYGYATPQYTVFSDIFSYGGSDGVTLAVDSYDPSGAAALLDDAGWVDSDGDGIRDKDGVSLDLTVICYPDEYILNAADILSTELSNLGINLNIVESADYPSYEASGDFDMIWTYEGVTRSGSPLYFLKTFLSSDGSGNHGGFSNSVVDEVCDKLSSTNDEAEIRNLIIQAENAISADGHIITWAMREIPFVYSSDVTFTTHAYRYYMIDETTDIEMN
jgi:peptide/nickel transport system substrate-binding protein